jgi:phospholipase A1
LSFKTKVLQSFFLGHGDFVGGLYKISHWQILIMIYRFREVNYEPELILNFPLNLNFFLIPEWLVWR